jgi:ubiquinone/menaquinone biosynthesis C-methylase UbiE
MQPPDPSGAHEHPRESFDRSAPTYDDHVRFNQAGAQRLIGALPEREYRDLLDVACGTGFATMHMIARRGIRSVIGIDASAGMLEQFRVKLAEYPKIAATLRVADVLEMGVPPASVDLVLCTMALHWFPDRERAVLAMAKTLRPGGILGILGPGPGHDAEFVRLSRESEPPILPELAASVLRNEIHPEAMRGYLAAAGLEEVDMWLERRERRVAPGRYLDRMRSVASHLWSHRPIDEQRQELARAEAALGAESTSGIFEYTFTKLLVIARAPQGRRRDHREF